MLKNKGQVYRILQFDDPDFDEISIYKKGQLLYQTGSSYAFSSRKLKHTKLHIPPETKSE